MEKNVIKKMLRYALCVLSIFFLFSCTSGYKEEKQNGIPEKSANPFHEPEFRKEGELTFIKKGEQSKIVTIDIEIADTLHEKTIGLMYRKSMADREGMLFVYGNLQSHFFWMKNTYIPLDMIFVDKKMKIVEIVKNTTPLSEELIPVHDDTQYAVEVNAGFTDKYNIQVEDSVVIKFL